MKKILLLLPAILFVFQSCSQKSKKDTPKEKQELKLSGNFGDYWYQGKAELTSYELEQVRYGEMRKGHAVLIFVTEDFSKEKQVKLDNPSENPDDAQKVLKLNFTKKFNTGIYPYSIMTSTFSPVYPEDDIHAVKVTTSVQEWCGHVFMQLNKGNGNYNAFMRSYFESEGDQSLPLEKTWLEDELWTLIRLDPSAIPSGNLHIIPSTEYIRLKHKELKSYNAEITQSNTDSVSVLSLEIHELNRSLKIYYSPRHPFTIEKWEETYPEGGEMMITTGTLKKRIMLDYWNKNKVDDSVYREELGFD
ncbi:hypothetical protein JKA74_08450 [Marivirga sp. S37H4]|uniref:Septum formation inhibitor Maf n=1 Tax=Marivirga aurantiaca TaxID=2802615 RepID=A0A934WYC4_9BACT|nr:hypothetical protein [Marivirga aurantiaca]MBK6265066.1 hypothetical protein [Marivirga aurantiaca]